MPQVGEGGNGAAASGRGELPHHGTAGLRSPGLQGCVELVLRNSAPAACNRKLNLCFRKTLSARSLSSKDL